MRIKLPTAVASTALILITSTLVAGMSGCATRLESKPLAEALSQGVHLDRSFPKSLPSKAAKVPHSQFVLIRSESAIGLLSPVPFVADVVQGAANDKAAERYESQYGRIDPYRIVADALQGSPVLAKGTGGMPLQPFAIVQECVDDRYRIALVAHVEAGKQVGRYFIHLRDTFTPDEITKPTPAVLDRMQSDLQAAAIQLRGLIERAARNELLPNGTRADVGSLHLIGGRAAGLVSPTLLSAKNAALVEEGPEHIIVRIDGAVSQPASTGGLLFGVHLLRKDQLHKFEKRPAAS